MFSCWFINVCFSFIRTVAIGFSTFLFLLLKFWCKLDFVQTTIQARIWAHLEPSFTCHLSSIFLSSFTWICNVYCGHFDISEHTNGIKWGLWGLPAQMDLMFIRLSISWAACGLRYPERWWDVPKTNGTVSEPGKCTVFRRASSRSEITCQYQKPFILLLSLTLFEDAQSVLSCMVKINNTSCALCHGWSTFFCFYFKYCYFYIDSYQNSCQVSSRKKSHKDLRILLLYIN